jgi:hypothetical protein
MEFYAIRSSFDGARSFALIITLGVLFAGVASCKEIPAASKAGGGGGSERRNPSESPVTDLRVGDDLYHVPTWNLSMATKNGFSIEGMLPTFRVMDDRDFISHGGMGLKNSLYMMLSETDGDGNFDDDLANLGRRLSSSTGYRHRVEGCLDAYRALTPERLNGPIDADDQFIPRCRRTGAPLGGFIRCTPKAYGRLNPVCEDTFAYRGNRLVLHYSVDRLANWEGMRRYATCKLDGLRASNMSAVKARSCGL